MKDSHDNMNFTAASTLIIHGDRDSFYPVEIGVEGVEMLSRDSAFRCAGRT